MKKKIHPPYFEKAVAKCVCGKAYTIGSTREYLEVETCANCHPAYTGQDKTIETMGKVEKYRERLKKTQRLQNKKR